MSETYTSGKAKILIVDDESVELHTMQSILCDKYAVIAATNGERALELAARQPQPDLIVLDVKMPGMDGYEVLRRLKSDPVTSDIPMIFVTSISDAPNEEYGLRLGALDYITKPVNPAILLARVHNHINLKLNADLLESQAMLDGLTGIPNRRCFEETFEREWKREIRSGSPLSLIMVDIDFFKQFNDHYGHAMGDECLKKVATSLLHSVNRPSDLVARYGGEEFVAILPDTDELSARVIAESFRAHVESLQIPHEYSDVFGYVTISVGLASVIPCIGMTRGDLIKLADDKLYQAKNAGRNRVC